MGSYWVMITRENEELTSHEIHAKDWNIDTLKTAEAVILLYSITMLRMISRRINQGKVDIHMDNKET